MRRPVQEPIIDMPNQEGENINNEEHQGEEKVNVVTYLEEIMKNVTGEEKAHITTY